MADYRYCRKWTISRHHIMTVDPDVMAQKVFASMQAEFNIAAKEAESLLIKSLKETSVYTPCEDKSEFYASKIKAYQFLCNGSNGLYDTDIWEEYLEKTNQLGDSVDQNGNSIRMAFELHGIPAMERLLKAQIRQRIKNAITTITTHPNNSSVKAFSKYPNNIIS